MQFMNSFTVTLLLPTLLSVLGMCCPHSDQRGIWKHLQDNDISNVPFSHFLLVFSELFTYFLSVCMNKHITPRLKRGKCICKCAKPHNCNKLLLLRMVCLFSGSLLCIAPTSSLSCLLAAVYQAGHLPKVILIQILHLTDARREPF